MVRAIAKKLVSALTLLGGAMTMMAAMPAHAADETAFAGGDAQFRQLFSSWKQLDSSSATAAPAVAVPSRMPVEGARLTSDFGMREHPVLGGRRAHKGVDLAEPAGTPVYATADGTVAMAQWFSGYGNYIQLEHGAGLETRYGHLSGYAVSSGQKVKKGQLIGYVGSTGRSTGPHLHYEVRVAGEAVNPIPYMIETTAQQAFALARGEGGKGGPE